MDEKEMYRSEDGRYDVKVKYGEREKIESREALVKAGTAAAVGLGAFVFGHRTGAFKGFARGLDVEGRALARAVKKNTSERNLKEAKFGKENRTKFQEDFLKERKKLKERRSRGLSEREFQIEKNIRQINQYIGNPKDKNSSILMDTVDDALRKSRVTEKVKESGDKELIEQHKRIMKSLNKMKLGDFRKASDTKIEKILKKDGIENQKIIDEFNKIRGRMSDKNLVKVDEEALYLYKNLSSKIQKEFTDQLVANGQKNGKVSRVLKGKERATVDDILEMHHEGKRKLDEVTRVSLERSKELNKDFGKVIYDKDLYVKKGLSGKKKVEDLSVFKEVNREVMEYFAGSMPGGIMHFRNILSIKESKENVSIKTLKSGTTQSAINPYLGKKSTDSFDQHYLYMQGKVYDIFDNSSINTDSLKLVNKKRDVFLVSSSYGSLSRMYKSMSGTFNAEEDRGLFARTFDLGRQDTDSIYGRVKSGTKKFSDDEWGRNKGLDIVDFGVSGEDDILFLKNLVENSGQNALSGRALKTIQNDLPDEIKTILNKDDFNFESSKDIQDLFKVIAEGKVGKGSPKTTDKFNRVYREYERSPEDFLMRQQSTGELNPLFKTPTQFLTGEDIIRGEVSSYLLSASASKRMNFNLRGTGEREINAGFNQIREELKYARDIRDLSREDYQNARRALDKSQFERLEKHFNSGDGRYTSEAYNALLDSSDELATSIRQTVKQKHKITESYNPNRQEDYIGDEHILIGKSHFGEHMSNIFGLNSSLSERYESTKSIVEQLYGSRKRMDDTTLITMAPFYSAFRLQDMLGQMGLGMSDSSMKSTAGLFMNLIGKRVFPAYAGYEGFQYIDYKMDEYTGRGITERYEDFKANERLLSAHEMTDSDRYEILKKQQLRPGIEHFEAMPSVYLPVLGEVNPLGTVSNIAASALSGNMFESFDSKESYTVTETYEDLFYGVEEVRKSKWWLIGSKSAYRGDRIVEFAPNSWRLAHSDWEYSGVGLTGEEYWSHSLFPTLENPLGIFSFALGLRNPYYFEEKHYEDRPYLLTGQLFNPNTPILGDIGNDTIGRIIKPVKQMHEEYWTGEIPSERPETFSRVFEDQSLLRNIERGGNISFYKNVPGYAYEDESQQFSEERIEESNFRIINQMNDRLYSSGTNNIQLRDYQGRDSQFIKKRNEDDPVYVFQYENYFRSGGASDGFLERAMVDDPTSTFVKTGYRHKEEFEYQKFYENELIDNVIDPRDGKWKRQEFIENITEPLGVYKWLAQDEIFGQENYQNKMVIEGADAANNISNQFWEMNLGSLGGAYSEMARRFVRRDSGQLEKYNPIRNTMPEWLPGEDYFTNFLIGDPYTKVSNGERRLPGAGYESLNELHPDEFGMYGAFDRFKILADVAPWSNEYKFWSEYVMRNEQDEELRKQAAQIRRQASKIKQKFDFQDYRFKGNEIQYESVTVDKVLDDYTFTTKEYGSRAIRLAGIEYRNTQTGLLSSFLSTGDRIEIGISSDPTERVSNDTYGTMKAVLRDRKTNINQMIIESGRAVEAMNDFSAPGIHARFNPEEIASGVRWETIAHAPTMINTKLLQVRTAVEEYERDQIYGKDWATWENLMTRDYLIPAIEGLGRYASPIASAAAGATTGAVVSFLTLPKGTGRKIATGAGAILGLGMYGIDKTKKLFSGEANIPQRRLDENEINEYYDFLQHLKYKALYDKSKEEYRKKYKFDVDKYLLEIEEKREEISDMKKQAENLKRWYYLNQPKGYKDKITLYNQILSQLEFDLDDGDINEELAQVLYYKQMSEQTLFAIDPLTASREEIMAALPHKDKYFFTEFADAKKKDRKKILELIPENQRRIYESLWSREKIDGPTMEEMLEKYHIPDAEWDGWKPEYDLNDIKMKTIAENNKLDLTDFGYWETDLYRGDFVPDLNEAGGNEILKGSVQMQKEAERVLRAAGLSDVKVLVRENNRPKNATNMDLTLDRTDEIEERLNRDISMFM